MEVSAILLILLSVYQSHAQLSAVDRNEILRAHNHVRSLVSPSATDMRRLVYSEELEGIAQEFAERCSFDHSDRDERNSKSPTFTQVGENIYVGAGLPVNYTDIIARLWGFDEAVDYNYQSNTCTPGKMCGHYTQIVWADTTHVGCGIARCSSVVGLNLPAGLSADLIFCNYGPAGNIIGRQPYESGTSCSACPSDLPECRENLCSPGQVPSVSSETPPTTTTGAPPPLPPSSGGQLSAMNREEILRAHNHVRSLVSPSATDMRRLVYSEELEGIAQEFAERCIFDHSDRDERNSKSPTFIQVGENIYVGAGLPVNYTDIIARLWGFNEAVDYNYQSNTCNPGRMCGHYTQIVWADTTHVGCGIARCSSVVGVNLPQGFIADLVFCNYGPAGNIIGRQPYESGTSCSACPSDLPECRENLCSPGQVPSVSSETPPTTTTGAPPPLPPSSGGQLSAMNREEILRAHNHVRSLVSPSATDMRRLVYSEELEGIAQEFTERCIFDHSDRDERNSKSPSFAQVGENIYVGAGLPVNYTDIIARLWGFDEAVDYNYQSNTCNPGRMCGHYTQIVWADTTHVGCGIARCSSVIGVNLPIGLPADLFFCNYGPAGNIIGRRPYESGTSCSACPSDLPMCLENLCSSTTEDPPSTTTEEPFSSPPTTAEDPTSSPTTAEDPTSSPTTAEDPTSSPTTTEDSSLTTTTEDPTSSPTTTTEDPTSSPPTTAEDSSPTTTTEDPFSSTTTTTEDPTSSPTTTTEDPTSSPPTTTEDSSPTTTTEETTASPVRPNEVGNFIEESPRVDSGRISVRIKFSALVQSALCSLTGQPTQDCTSGSVEWSMSTDIFRNLLFLVRVEIPGRRPMRMRRIIKIGPPHLCIVNFVNDGVTVFTNGTAMLDFTSTGPSSSFLCSMDRGQLLPCSSGKLYHDLGSGTHRIKVVANNCGRNRRNAVLKFKI